MSINKSLLPTNFGINLSINPQEALDLNNNKIQTADLFNVKGLYGRRKDENPILKLALDTTFPKWNSLKEKKTVLHKEEYKSKRSCVYEKSRTSPWKRGSLFYSPEGNKDNKGKPHEDTLENKEENTKTSKEIYIEKLKNMGPKYVKKRPLSNTVTNNTIVKNQNLRKCLSLDENQKMSKFKSDITLRINSPSHYKTKLPGTYIPYYDPRLTAKNVKQRNRSKSMYLPNEIEYKRKIYKSLKTATEMSTKSRNEIETYLSEKFAEFVKVNEVHIKEPKIVNEKESLKCFIPTIKNGRKMTIVKSNSFSTNTSSQKCMKRIVNKSLSLLPNKNMALPPKIQISRDKNIQKTSNPCQDKADFRRMKSIFPGATEKYIIDLEEKVEEARNSAFNLNVFKNKISFIDKNNNSDDNAKTSKISGLNLKPFESKNLFVDKNNNTYDYVNIVEIKQ